jgi:hypothetical protein
VKHRTGSKVVSQNQYGVIAIKLANPLVEVYAVSIYVEAAGQNKNFRGGYINHFLKGHGFGRAPRSSF